MNKTADLLLRNDSTVERLNTHADGRQITSRENAKINGLPPSSMAVIDSE
ncbi:MAG: hypothetical protein ACLTOI_10145 [Faecalibacterium sp.]